MQDIGYSQKLKNQIDFSIYAGLQYFKQSFKLFAVIQQQRDNLNKRKEASIDDLMEQDRLFDKEMMKYRILLTLINSLCDKYQIDKKSKRHLSAQHLNSDPPDPPDTQPASKILR